jgi:hypothetical protein
MPTIWIFVIGFEQGWKLAAVLTVLMVIAVGSMICLRAAIELWRGGPI